jgi:hypothetical protein
MPTTDFINSADTSHAYSSGDSNPGYSIDNNFNTAMYYSSGDSSSGGTSLHTATSTHTFIAKRTITQWKYRVKNTHYATGPSASHSGWWKVEYKVNGGAWTTLAGSFYTYSGGETGGGSYDSGTITLNVTVEDVTDVRLTSYAQSDCYDGHRSVETNLYEVEAYGASYSDIGLRVYNHSIGVETLESSHKLRVNKAGTIYGIPLLATDDSNATPVRIFDGSAVKALPKVT